MHKHCHTYLVLEYRCMIDMGLLTLVYIKKHGHIYLVLDYRYMIGRAILTLVYV